MIEICELTTICFCTLTPVALVANSVHEVYTGQLVFITYTRHEQDPPQLCMGYWVPCDTQAGLHMGCQGCSLHHM